MRKERDPCNVHQLRYCTCYYYPQSRGIKYETATTTILLEIKLPTASDLVLLLPQSAREKREKERERERERERNQVATRWGVFWNTTPLLVVWSDQGLYGVKRSLEPEKWREARYGSYSGARMFGWSATRLALVNLPQLSTFYRERMDKSGHMVPKPAKAWWNTLHRDDWTMWQKGEKAKKVEGLNGHDRRQWMSKVWPMSGGVRVSDQNGQGYGLWRQKLNPNLNQKTRVGQKRSTSKVTE